MYILGNGKGTLYVGVTNDLARRLIEHRAGKASKFTNKYRVNQLLFTEEFPSVYDAIAAEKRIKGMDEEEEA